MQPRSIEILETIKRSTKAFTEYDVLDFAREIARLSSEERAKLFQKAKKNKPRAPADPSAAPKLVRGISAARAKDSILAMLEQERPELLKGLTSAEKKSYAAICRGLFRLTKKGELENLVRAAIEQFSGTTSTDWHPKPAS